jgi:pilus assembly protein FimV
MATEHLLDFDLDDLDDLPDSDDAKFDLPTVAAPVAAVTAGAAASSATNLNLHLDNDNGLNRILPKDTFYAPISDEDKDWLGDIDDALSFLDFPDEEIDLHEAHISTKLDLARAYLDMGDIEGARSTLEEVMVEGNDDQRREAEVLLHQTG